ncbi:unnamed protein product [Brassica oleracea]
MEPVQHGVQDVLNISTVVHVFYRTRQTDRAVYWTVPHAFGKELWLEPWTDDRSDRTGSCPSHELSDLSDTTLELDELSKLSDTRLELNELSNTEDRAGSAAGRNETFQPKEKTFLCFLVSHIQVNIPQNRWTCESYQATTRDPSFGGLVSHIKHQLKLGISEAFRNLRSTVWHELFDTAVGDITVSDVLKMLRNPYLAPWKRVHLALIALVDGVICCSNKWLKLTPKYVEMLCNVEYFLDYPWGRESFLKTLPRLLPPYTSEDPLGEMRHHSSQQTTAAYGFPLALQLFAFEAVPLLLAKISNAQSTDNFLVNPPACENTVTILSVNDIVEVEEDPYVSLRFSLSHFNYVFDKLFNQRVMHLVDLMLSGHRFQKSDFPGGDTLFAPVVDDKENVGKGVRKVAQRNDQPVHCHNLHPRKPAAVIIEGISSSEDREPEARPQADRCTHEDLKPWIEQQFKQLASAFQK